MTGGYSVIEFFYERTPMGDWREVVRLRPEQLETPQPAAQPAGQWGHEDEPR